MSKRKSKKDHIEIFLENLPVENDIVKILNNNIEEIRKRLINEEVVAIPSSICNSELIEDSCQYGDESDTYTMVWYLPDYHIHVGFKYFYSSYDGEDYDEIEFKKLNSVTKTLQVFEEFEPVCPVISGAPL